MEPPGHYACDTISGFCYGHALLLGANLYSGYRSSMWKPMACAMRSPSARNAPGGLVLAAGRSHAPCHSGPRPLPFRCSCAADYSARLTQRKQHRLRSSPWKRREKGEGLEHGVCLQAGCCARPLCSHPRGPKLPRGLIELKGRCSLHVRGHVPG